MGSRAAPVTSLRGVKTMPKDLTLLLTLTKKRVLKTMETHKRMPGD